MVSQQRRRAVARRHSRCHGNLQGGRLCAIQFGPGASHLLCPPKLFKPPQQGLQSRQVPLLSSSLEEIKCDTGFRLHAAEEVAAGRENRLPCSEFLPVSRASSEPPRAEPCVGKVTSRRWAQTSRERAAHWPRALLRCTKAGTLLAPRSRAVHPSGWSSDGLRKATWCGSLRLTQIWVQCLVF